MKTFRANASQHGFSLIELMIAMLIGVFLMAGIIQIFISAKQAYRLQENLSRLQENGRFAIDIITKDIRMAGFAGCSVNAPRNIILKNKDSIPALNTGISGVDGANVTASGWNGIANTVACANQCVAGTDVISFQSAGYCRGRLLEDADKSAQLKIITPNECGLQQGDVAILANCSNVDIFAVTNNPGDGSVLGNGQQTLAHAANLNDPHFLGSDYSKYNSEILVPRLYSYFFRMGANGTPALWRIDNAKAVNPSVAGGELNSDQPENPVELIEGIENMKILYGVDIPNAKGEYDFVPNYYVKASEVTDWAKVVSLRVSLLVVTADNALTDEPQSYLYDGKKIPPDICTNNGIITQLPCMAPARQVQDRRIRRVFSSTIAVRNRLP